MPKKLVLGVNRCYFGLPDNKPVDYVALCVMLFLVARRRHLYQRRVCLSSNRALCAAGCSVREQWHHHRRGMRWHQRLRGIPGRVLVQRWLQRRQSLQVWKWHPRSGHVRRLCRSRRHLWPEERLWCPVHLRWRRWMLVDNNVLCLHLGKENFN